MPFLPTFAGESNLMAVLMHNPERGQPLMAFTREVMRGESAFSPAERELIFAFVSGLNACAYCFGQHGHAARLLGIDDGVIDKLLDDIESAPVDGRMKPVLAYVRTMTQTPSRVTQADVDAVLAAGWDDTAVLDAGFVAALANLMNRLVDGNGLAMDQAGLEQIGVMIAQGGYRPKGPVAG